MAVACINFAHITITSGLRHYPLIYSNIMKKTGNTSDFKEERDQDLHRSFMEVLKTAVGVPLREMFGLAAARPSRRFWVSEGRASIVIGAMMRGEALSDKVLPKRRAMYEEIYRRVRQCMEENPRLCMTHAVNEVVYQPAPEFYIEPEAARSIIYRYRQRRKNKANHKNDGDRGNIA